MMKKLALIAALVWTLGACGGKNETLFEDLPASQTGVDFVNRSLDRKDFNIFRYRNFYNGGGVAIGDVNNDGFPDLFLTSNFEENKLYLNKGNMDESSLQFVDITKQAGIAGKKFWSTGVTFADVNGDGWLDIYVCNSGSRDARGNQLYINQGVTAGGPKNGQDKTPAMPRFVEKSAEYGLTDGGFSTHAAFFDYDRDGDLDMYLLNNSFTPMDRLGFANTRDTRDRLGGHKLFRNEGNDPDGKPKPFVDVSEQAGIYGSLIGFGLGITIGDVNNDNWPDIYISNDFYERDYLYINQQNGKFKEDIKNQMGHISLASMGADIADLNNDGNLDIFVTDMLPDDDYRLKTTTSFDSYELNQLKESRDFHHQDSRNMLHLNNGNGTFSEIGRMSGVSATDWSWGALLFDMDMDGFKDVFVANGILKDLTDQDYIAFLADNPDLQSMVEGTKTFDYKDYVDKMGSSPLANYAFRNNGNGMQYENKAADWGLAQPGFSNGSAYGDLDNDGDLDLVVNNNNAPVSIYKNRSVELNKRNFLRVRLNGYGMNRNAIGTKVYVHQAGIAQYLQQMPNRGFQSSVDLTMVFGLGDNPAIDSLTVIWPDNKKQVLRQPKANTTQTLAYTNANQLAVFPAALPTQPLPAVGQWFSDVTGSSKLDFEHRENDFVDYNRDGLLKQMLSREGPALAVGDVNGDNLEDVFLGGAANMPRSLYLQLPDGKGFTAKKQPFLLDANYTEDVAATFFDADGDRDLDLYVATGGNEFDDPTYLQDRLFRNDGTGNFTWDKTVPRSSHNNSCVVAADFDRDGDQDLFVGSRMISGRYGQNPDHLLLVNEGGKFRKATNELIPFASQIGMVKDAVWADIDNDTYPDLVLAGDWMPITILKNKAGKGFERLANETLAKSGGWWNTIRAADLDKDGDLDFVVGNEGLNSRMVASANEPARLYGNDFDRNGSYEQVVTCYRKGLDGQSRPCLMMQKPDLQKRVPSIKNRYIKHTDYAKASFEEVFTAQQREGTTVQTAHTAETSILINNGQGQFTLKPLPVQAQTSPIHAILTDDYNGDGKTDLLLAGNFFDVLTELGRYDANYGLLLLGDGKLNFKATRPEQTGFFVRGQVRRMQAVRGANSKSYLVLAKNNDRAQVFSLK